MKKIVIALAGVIGQTVGKAMSADRTVGVKEMLPNVDFEKISVESRIAVRFILE